MSRPSRGFVHDLWVLDVHTEAEECVERAIVAAYKGMGELESYWRGRSDGLLLAIRRYQATDHSGL